MFPQSSFVRQLFGVALCSLILFPVPSAAQAMTAVMESQDPVGDLKILVFGCDSDYHPMSFLEDGKPAGFDVELIQELGRHLGFTPVIILDTWSAILDRLRFGEIDVVAGILKTDDRSRVFDYSIPYRTDAYALFSRHDSGLIGLKQLAGYRLALLRDDAALELHLRATGLGEGLLEYPDTLSAFRAVIYGEADYTIAPSPYGFSLMDTTEFRGKIQKSRALFAVDYRLAFLAGRADLQAAFNDALATLIRNGYLDQAQRRWRVYHPFPVSASAALSPLNIILVAFAAACSLFAFLVWLLVGMGLRKSRAAIARLEAIMDKLPLSVYWQKASKGQCSDTQEDALWHPLVPENDARSAGARDAVVVCEQTPQSVWYRKGIVEIPEHELRVLWSQDWDWEYKAQARIQTLAAELTELMCSLEETRTLDPGSGLFSRSFFAQVVQQAELQVLRSGEGYGLVMFRDGPLDILESRVLAGIIRSVLESSEMAFRLDDTLYAVLVQSGLPPAAQTGIPVHRGVPGVSGSNINSRTPVLAEELAVALGFRLPADDGFNSSNGCFDLYDDRGGSHARGSVETALACGEVRFFIRDGRRPSGTPDIYQVWLKEFLGKDFVVPEKLNDHTWE
jgi:polar amino acid transport system substrate-binding protein